MSDTSKYSSIVNYCVEQMLAQQKRPLLVAITGDSGSGKSYYSKRIQRELEDRDIEYSNLNHDEFLIPRKDREPLKEQQYTEGRFAGKTYYDILANWFRLDEFRRVITDLRAGKDTAFQPYTKRTGEISKTKRHVVAHDFIIIDTSILVKEMDFVIEIEVDVDTIIERKLLRDFDLRTPEQIIEMHRTVQYPHWQRVQPDQADIVIDNSNIRNPIISHPLDEKPQKTRLNLADYQAVLFNLDGTIVNNMAFHFYALAQLAHDRDVEVESETFKKKYSGKKTKHILPKLLNRELSEAEMDELYAEKLETYQQSVQKRLKPISGFTEFLNAVKKHRLKVGLVTTASKQNRNFNLEQLKLDDVFDVVIGPEDVESVKPDPDMYQLAADKLGVDSTKCLVFEDSPPGVQSAKAVNMTVVGVLSTHTPEELSDTDMLIQDYGDLVW